MNFEALANNIIGVQDALQSQAAHAVNLSLTVRNWIVGCYIVEFEQNGEDRAQYGEQLLKKLAKRLNRRGFGERRLYEFRQFFSTYPYLNEEVTKYLQQQGRKQILRSTTAKLSQIKTEDNINDITILRSTTAILKNVALEAWQTQPEQLFNRLSATHLIYMSNIKEPLKRAFYEQEAIKGCWTIKELDRQVSSLYFERMGLSKDKLALQYYANKGVMQLQSKDIIHDPVTLEFLGLQSQDIFSETKLETAILNHLQHFLLEMGRGFCFEARQKRILIDRDYFKADLVFYHRILKCHVIVDLKIDRFRHEYASQLNMYLNYYKHEVMEQGDNPPIGLLLCADYGETTVRYATEGLSNVYVSQYRLQLPTEDEIRDYLLKYMPNESIEDDFIEEGGEA